MTCQTQCTDGQSILKTNYLLNVVTRSTQSTKPWFNAAGAFGIHVLGADKWCYRMPWGMGNRTLEAWPISCSQGASCTPQTVAGSFRYNKFTEGSQKVDRRFTEGPMFPHFYGCNLNCERTKPILSAFSFHLSHEAFPGCQSRSFPDVQILGALGYQWRHCESSCCRILRSCITNFYF